MNTKRFSEAMDEIDDKYINKAVSHKAKNTLISHTKRRISFSLAAAIMSIFLIGSAVAVAFIYGDLWLQKPSNDPVESVRIALENQVGKDYTIKTEVKSIEIDEAETAHTVERFLNGPIPEWNNWSNEYLAEHFLAVKAVYYAEYDHTQTTRNDGEITMYFYLTQDVDSGEWTIIDNSGNINWLESCSADESGDLTTKSTKEQLFFCLSGLFNKAYSPYYDGLHYEMSDYQETTDGSKVTATFLWTMYFLGKGWDVATDQGVEQEANWFLQATIIVNEDGVLDLETISILADVGATENANFNVSIEEYFPS